MFHIFQSSSNWAGKYSRSSLVIPWLCPTNITLIIVLAARGHTIPTAIGRNRLNIGSCLTRRKIFHICCQRILDPPEYYINGSYLSIDSAYVCSLFSNSWLTMQTLRFLDSQFQQCKLCFTHMTQCSSMSGQVDLKFFCFVTATIYELCSITQQYSYHVCLIWT